MKKITIFYLFRGWEGGELIGKCIIHFPINAQGRKKSDYENLACEIAFYLKNDLKIC
jgi:hypothetical protein